ncbi:hypothetical protein Q4S31_11165, partial [Morganella morganii]
SSKSVKPIAELNVFSNSAFVGRFGEFFELYPSITELMVLPHPRSKKYGIGIIICIIFLEKIISWLVNRLVIIGDLLVIIMKKTNIICDGVSTPHQLMRNQY